MGRSLRIKFRLLLIIFLVAFLLVSCETTNDTSALKTDSKHFDTVNLKNVTTKADLKKAFNDKVVMQQPKLGLVTIKTNIDVSNNSFVQQGILLEIFNQNNRSVSTLVSTEAATPITQNVVDAGSGGTRA